MSNSRRCMVTLSLILSACAMDDQAGVEDEDLGEESAELSTFARSIQNVYSGKCLDIPWGSAQDGEPINQFNCHGGPAQQFVIEPIHAGGAFRIRNVSTNKCVLTLGTTAPFFTPESFRLVQGSCTHQYAEWRKVNVQAIAGGERLSFAHYNDTRYCMDVPGDRWWQDSIQLQAYKPCHGGALQRFDVRP